jgi:diacylglycerol kinase (ATP)
MLYRMKGMIRREQFAMHCALAGLIQFFVTERRSASYLIATMTVFTAGWLLGVSATEFLFLTGATISVWVAEMFNTCVEGILDLLHPGIHPKVKRIKDLSAGAVLFTCIGSTIIAFIIFLPKIF